MQSKKWFELDDIISLDPERQSWTSLWEFKSNIKEGQRGKKGFVEETHCNRVIAFPVELKGRAIELTWDDVSLGFGNYPNTYSSEYHSVEVANGFYQNDISGVYLALEQYFDTDPKVIYINQDLVFALRLLQDGDNWINSYEDGVVVAKIERDEDCNPKSLKIRTDYLRDYLCARNMGVVIYSYCDRHSVDDVDPNYWKKLTKKNESFWDWAGETFAVHEGGMLYGTKTSVISVTRENTEYNKDIPDLQTKNEEDNKVEFYDKKHTGKKLFSSYGRLWINKWLAPFDESPRVKGDKEVSKTYFKVDVNNKLLSGDELKAHEGWLWFKPDLIREILKRNKSSLIWHTENTGEVGFHMAEKLDFGVNKLGLINILAYDIWSLSEYHKNIVVGFNIIPDGGVSKELLMAQKDGNPAGTCSPEWLLGYAFRCLEDASNKAFNRSILREHENFEKILKSIHRFRSIKECELFELANDLHRVFVERLDKSFLLNISGASDKKIGTIKLLEKFISRNGCDGKKLTAVLVGCYELRHCASHLPSSCISNAYILAKLDESGSPYKNGKALISAISSFIGCLSRLIIDSSDE